MNHHLAFATSQYTKLMKIKIFRKSILKLNNQSAGKWMIGHLTSHDGMYASKLLLQH
jgi:hypothetical protein